MTVLNIVLPVFIVIGLGWGLRRGGFLSAGDNTVLTRLVYWVAAPALLFRSAAITPLRESANLPGLAVMGGVTVGVGIVVYALAFRAALHGNHEVDRAAHQLRDTSSLRSATAGGQHEALHGILGTPAVHPEQMGAGGQCLGSVPIVVDNCLGTEQVAEQLPDGQKHL